MDKKCYVCNTTMVHKNMPVNTGWGSYKVTIDGFDVDQCPNCGEIVLDGSDAIKLQKISKALAESPSNPKPDFLNLTETADLLRVSNQTIYNMIKDGRLKAFKIGREWRFIRREIMSISEENEYGSLAARGKTTELDKNDEEIIKKYL